MDGPVVAVAVLVEGDVGGGLDIRGGGIERLALLHERVVSVPGPGFSAGAIVLGLHEITPGVVFRLGRPNEEQAIDRR